MNIHEFLPRNTKTNRKSSRHVSDILSHLCCLLKNLYHKILFITINRVSRLLSQDLRKQQKMSV